jgi:putative endonuclease
MAKHNILGEKGEQIAERFLVKNNYRILAKNWRYKSLEVDIFAQTSNYLVAVEVKTRSSDFVENLNEIVTKKKQRFIIEATNAYLEKMDFDYEARFDIIFIIIKDGKYHLKHIPDAFSAIG